MKKAISFIISLSIGIGLFAWIISFVGWQETLSAFSIFTGWAGGVIILLTFLMLFASCWKWKVILKSLGYDMSFRQLLAPYLTCYSISYLFQMIVIGGELFRVYVLKEKYSVPWKKGITSVAIDKILESTVYFIAILSGVIFFLFKIGLPPKNMAIILGIIIFVLILGFIFIYFKIFKKESIASPILKFFSRKGVANEDVLEIEKETFSFFRLTRLYFWQGLGLAFLRVGITWLKAWLLILFLGKSISFIATLPILGFYYIAMIIPIPADLGTHEAIQVFAFNALGIGQSLAPAFAMIQRGAELLFAFIGILLFFKLGMGLVRSLIFKKIEKFMLKT